MPEKIPSKINLGEEQIAFSEIVNKFSSTKWGDTLRNQIRYSPHKPKELTPKDWQKILGGDVNNLHHLVVSKGLTESFLKNCATPDKEWKGEIPDEANFSAREQEMLLLTAIVHDWAEAIVGDITYHAKTENDHVTEMLELKILIRKILNEMLSQESAGEIEKLADQVVSILTNTTSKLGKAFNAIERAGYVRTGIRAYDESKKASDELRTPLRNMACEVVPCNIGILLDYAKIYPAIASFMRHHEKTIGEIFTAIENSPIRATIPKLEEALEKWSKRSI